MKHYQFHFYSFSFIVTMSFMFKKGYKTVAFKATYTSQNH
jgi:hypothetical protein